MTLSAINPTKTKFSGVGRDQTMAQIITEASMKTLKDAILGTK